MEASRVRKRGRWGGEGAGVLPVSWHLLKVTPPFPPTHTHIHTQAPPVHLAPTLASLDDLCGVAYHLQVSLHLCSESNENPFFIGEAWGVSGRLSTVPAMWLGLSKLSTFRIKPHNSLWQKAKVLDVQEN